MKNLKLTPEDPDGIFGREVEKKQIKSIFLYNINRKLVLLRELLLGRTKKQTEGEKPFYFGKQVLFQFSFFLLYSFIVFARMNLDIEDDKFFDNTLNILCFGIEDVYSLGIAITFAYFQISLLLCNEKFLKFFYQNNYFIKQLILIPLTVGLNYLYAPAINDSNVDVYSSLLIFSMLWLIFQTIRIYSAARNGATKIEKQFSEKYSPILYSVAVVLPIFILGIIFFISLAFRFYIVLYTLDYLGTPDRIPAEAFSLYQHEMNVIIPMLYGGLFLITLFIVLQFILSRKKGSTKRSGTFDNLTFCLISLVIFLYAIYNIALYLFLDPNFVQALNNANEGESSSSSFLIFEFILTILFLYWIVYALMKQFRSGFMFLTSNGLIMFLMCTIFAQQTSRLGIMTDKAGELSGLANILSYDYLILPWFIIIFLGFTFVLYWIKPQEFSMFMHMNAYATNKEDRNIDIILSFLKREFIRRGEKFKITKDILNSLIHVTGMQKAIILSLFNRIAKKYVDVQIYVEETDAGEKSLYFDFLPITERYQKSKLAEIRAKKYLQDQFKSSINKKQKKRLLLKKGGNTSTSKQSDVFIQALSVQYGRKIKDEASIKTKQEDEQLIIDRAIDEPTQVIIYELIKNEYLRRIKQVADYEVDFRFKVSEITEDVEKLTKIGPGRLYPLLAELAVENWNFNLSRFGMGEDELEEDRWIEFLPITDFEIYEALLNYRPNHIKEIVVLMQTWFYRNIFFKRKALEQLPPKVYNDEDEEYQRSYRSKWFAATMEYFNYHFQQKEEERDRIYHSKDLQNFISQIINCKIDEHKKNRLREIKEEKERQKQVEMKLAEKKSQEN